MTNPDLDDDDKPLDPAALRLQQKLRRLVFFSSLIMVAGLIAVFSAILYKVNSGGRGADRDAAYAATVSVGPEARIRSVQVEDDRLLVLVEEGSSTALLQIDATTGRLIGRTDFVAR